MKFKNLNEDFEDIVEEETPKAPEPGANMGMANVISSLIQDEWEAIDGYNSAIATAIDEGLEDIVPILEDIVNEENIHVGQLEQLLTLLSPNAQSIEDGKEETQEILK